MKDPVAFEALCNEIRLAMHRLVQVGEAVHADEPVTLGMRGVLEFLERNGDATVPQIARSRHVTRQHIQSLVNSLVEGGWVALRDNPAHRRSPLVSLTRAGARQILRMRRKERRAFAAMPIEATDAQIEAATRTLRRVIAGMKEPDA